MNNIYFNSLGEPIKPVIGMLFWETEDSKNNILYKEFSPEQYKQVWLYFFAQNPWMANNIFNYYSKIQSDKCCSSYGEFFYKEVGANPYERLTPPELYELFGNAFYL